MEKISSDQNQKFKNWKSLLEPKHLKKSDYFLASGEAWVKEIINQHSDKIKQVIIPESHEIEFENIDKSILLDNKLFKEIDIYGTKSPIALVKKPILEKWDQSNEAKGLELIIPLGDPSNMGALLRNAAAFGVKNIVLLKESCSPFHPKSVRASAGNLLNFNFSKGPSIHELKSESSLFCLDASGTNVASFRFPSNLRLLVGEEGPGIPAGLRRNAQCLSLPMEKQTESLNANFAASIVLYEHYKGKEK